MIWKKRVEEAIAAGQRPLVVYFEEMTGDDTNGLGNSQKGEVKWLRSNGIDFDQVDVRLLVTSVRDSLTDEAHFWTQLHTAQHHLQQACHLSSKT